MPGSARGGAGTQSRRQTQLLAPVICPRALALLRPPAPRPTEPLSAIAIQQRSIAALMRDGMRGCERVGGAGGTGEGFALLSVRQHLPGAKALDLAGRRVGGAAPLDLVRCVPGTRRVSSSLQHRVRLRSKLTRALQVHVVDARVHGGDAVHAVHRHRKPLPLRLADRGPLGLPVRGVVPEHLAALVQDLDEALLEDNVRDVRRRARKHVGGRLGPAELVLAKGHDAHLRVAHGRLGVWEEQRAARVAVAHSADLAARGAHVLRAQVRGLVEASPAAGVQPLLLHDAHAHVVRKRLHLHLLEPRGPAEEGVLMHCAPADRHQRLQAVVLRGHHLLEKRQRREGGGRRESDEGHVVHERERARVIILRMHHVVHDVVRLLAEGKKVCVRLAPARPPEAVETAPVVPDDDLELQPIRVDDVPQAVHAMRGGEHPALVDQRAPAEVELARLALWDRVVAELPRAVHKDE
eukprot:3612382-Rhodomonas_salina.1